MKKINLSLWLAIIGILLITSIVRWLYYRLKSSGAFYNIKPRYIDGYQKISNISGAEDIVALSCGGALISSLNRYEHNNGIIFYKPPGELPIPLKGDYPTQFFPHGIDVLEKDQKVLLYVINHRQEGDFVDVFLFLRETMTLQYQEKLSKKVEKNLNDLSVIDEETFVVTRDHLFSGVWGRIEDFLALPFARVLFVSNDCVDPIIKYGLRFANGIYYDKRWNGRLFIAETIRGSVATYEWCPGGKPKLLSRLNNLYGVDNITYDKKTDSFLIAAHPQLLKLSKYQKDILMPSPSLVWRIRTDENGIMRYKEVFYENGSAPLAAASVATALPDCYLIGSVFDTGVLLKKIN